MPKVARLMDHMALVRSMSTKEGDHGRAAYYLRTGNLPIGALQFPTLGSLISKELGDPQAELPNFVCCAPSKRAAIVHRTARAAGGRPLA